METTKKTTRTNDVKRMARADYYDNDVMVMNSTVKNGKNTNVPFLNKKQAWLKNYLLQNEIEKNYSYTCDGLSNEYRKTLKETAEKSAKKENYKFRKNFKSGEVVNPTDCKAVMQFIYITEKRLFEFTRSQKGNYYLHEIEYRSDLLTFKNDFKK